MNPVTIEEITVLAAWDTPALSNARDSLRLRSHNAGFSDRTPLDGLLALKRVRQ